MSVLVPPPQDDLELLIREARARQRKRWIGVAAIVAVLAGAALAISSLVGGTTTSTSTNGRQRPAAASAIRCGVQVKGVRIFHGRRLAYREPVSRTFGHQMQCSGASIWVVFFNGVASSQEAYFGVHSADGGRTWRAAFTERYFGLKAPHQLDSYMGPWTLTGHSAYFTGLCPACGRQPTVSLWVTRDGGRTFRRYEIAALDGYWPKKLHVSGARAIISADRHGDKKTVEIRVA